MIKMIYAYWDKEKWEQVGQRPPKSKEFYIGYKDSKPIVMKATKSMIESKMVVKPKDGVEIDRVDAVAEYVRSWSKI
jgi:hypothetical protein